MRNLHRGFLSSLQSQLEKLSVEKLSLVNRRGGLEIADHIELLANPKDYSVYQPDQHQCSVQISTNTTDSSSTKIGLCLFLDDTYKGPFPEHITRHLSRFVKVWAICGRNFSKNSSDNFKVEFLENFSVLPMTPDNRLSDIVDVLSDGPGACIPLLKESGQLERFIEDGGRHICIVDVQNCQKFDTTLLDCHAMKDSFVTCGVVEREWSDTCQAVLCNDRGIDQLIEFFRIVSLDPDVIMQWKSSGAYVVNASLDFDSVDWQWHRRKFVVDGAIVYRFQRYLDDLTRVFRTTFVKQ